MLMRQVTMRQQRHWPLGFCPVDLKAVRTFYAPLQRNTIAGAIGNPTFTRATVATQLDQDASTVDDVASGVERFEDHGYLGEGSRENKCLRSEEINVDGSGSPWNHASCSVSANATTAPDGNTTADTIVENGTSATHRVTQSITVTDGADLTFSFYAKASNRTWVYAQINEQTGPGDHGCNASWNLGTGAVGTTSVLGSGTFTAASIVDVGNGWYRCILTGKIRAGQTDGFFWVSPASANNTPTYLGTSQDSIHLWGAQVEEAASVSSYIPTTTIAVTRNIDDLWYPSTSNYTSARGVVYAEADLNAAAAANRAAVTVDSNGTANEHFLIYDAAEQVSYQVRSGSAPQATITQTGAVAAGTITKIAGAYNTDDFELYVDGASAGTPDTGGTVPASVSRIWIGDRSNDSSTIYGHVRNVQIFSERLTGFDVARIR